MFYLLLNSHGLPQGLTYFILLLCVLNFSKKKKMAESRGKIQRASVFVSLLLRIFSIKRSYHLKYERSR